MVSPPHLAEYCVPVLPGRDGLWVALEQLGGREEEGGRTVQDQPGAVNLGTTTLLSLLMKSLTWKEGE